KKAWLTCAYTHLQAGVFTPEFAMSASGTKQPQKGFQWTAMSEKLTLYIMLIGNSESALEL
ncbi:hypothetical protein ACNSO7_15870, partial [Yersinia enterocolitica]|uniref:hypothetical protein n=1 Tax=Yersinia enterocolitica TaxID=630 RepID=UPI003AB57342